MKNALVGVVVALAMTQAVAVKASESYTITGPTTNLDVAYSTPGLLGGEYLLRYEGAAPLYSLFIEDTYQYVFNDYDYYGNNVGGDESPILNDYFVTPHSVNFTATTSFPYIPAGGTIVYSTNPECLICTEVYFYSPVGTSYEFYFDDDPATGEPAPGGFTFTISAVPEPEMWLLLSLGLGGVGCALRRFRSPAKLRMPHS